MVLANGGMMGGRILVTGACGQIGTELIQVLKGVVGEARIVSLDIRDVGGSSWLDTVFIRGDVRDRELLFRVVREFRVEVIYHLAALLSATGERRPEEAWTINMDSLWHVLMIAKEVDHVRQVFWPSSIAVFGPTTPKERVPQVTVMEPNTIYGITKLAGERLCEYFCRRWQVDVRGLRYPGLISYRSLPGGGTTDYAVEIFFAALREGRYTCYLSADRCLPMMYIDDAIRGTLELMDAPRSALRYTVYNFAAISFSPSELESAIRAHLPDFEVEYKPDYRDAIAAQWPCSIDDGAAREDWGWAHRYDLPALVKVMLEGVRQRIREEAVGLSSPS